ncbi:MAG: hypothetical protein ACO3A4_13740 [Silvanigrellaceae bacterium]
MLIHSANASNSFRELTSRFSGVRLANPDDSARIAEFINATSMSSGALSVGFTRGEDYFAMLRLQSEKHAALVCEEQGRIVACGALSVRPSTLRGQPATLGYLQDLRVDRDASPKVRQGFYNCFAEFVRICPQLADFDQCSLFLTAILDKNIPAKLALSRQSFPLEYNRVVGYKAHVWPKAPRLGGRLILKANEANGTDPALIEFYGQQLGKFAFDLTLGDIHRLSEHAQPVILQEDGKIIAACLLVQTNEERKLLVKQPKLGTEFETSGTYITAMRVSRSLSAENALSAKQKLLRKALAQANKMQGIFTGFIETENNPLKVSGIHKLLDFKVEGSLYRVYHPDHTALPDFAKGFLRPAHIPAFDWVFS